MSFIYIACPYTQSGKGEANANLKIMKERHRAVEKYTAHLLNERVAVYSPIVHCHELAINHKLPKDAGFWMWYNDSMLIRADELYVLGLDGWEDSAGVVHEILFALQKDIPVTYIDPNELYKNWITGGT